MGCRACRRGLLTGGSTLNSLFASESERGLVGFLGFTRLVGFIGLLGVLGLGLKEWLRPLALATHESLDAELFQTRAQSSVSQLIAQGFGWRGCGVGSGSTARA